MTPIDVAYAALCDAGRPDLALLIVWMDDEPGGYIELLDEVSDADGVLVMRAEQLARMFAKAAG